MTTEATNTRFSQLVLPHLNDAYSLALWLTGNSSDAEDVVQEACICIFRGIDGFAGGSARAWVLTIVRNTAYSWLDKNRSRLVVKYVEDLEAADAREANINADFQTAEAALIAKADSELIERTIAALPPVFRETLVLRDLQGLSYRKIAEVTGVPIGTVMSRLARARNRLLAAMSRDS